MRKEIVPLLRLALPVVLAEIGWMGMGLVDTLMVGPLGPAAIGAAGVGNALFFAVAIFGMGVMLGLDALVSQSFGARRLDDCIRWLQHGMLLSAITAPVLMVISYGGWLTMDLWGLHPGVKDMASAYMGVIILGTPALLFYATFRRYLQGMHLVRPVMMALITANLVNAAGNWVLVYGHLGVPALGIAGSAWATNLARLYMATFLGIAILLEHRRRGVHHPQVPFVFDAGRLRGLFRMGAPAAAQTMVEVGVFGAVTIIAGRLDPTSLGSHQIALNVASLAFMVPLGLASAAAVQVGHAVGGGRTRDAVAAGWASLVVGLVAMLLVALPMLAMPVALLRPFSQDPGVLATGARLLAIAAAFQLFDGAQAVATGVLRGVGDTRSAFVMNVIGHWVVGLPCGYLLCFVAGWGVAGLWIGLSIGLTIVALALTLIWRRRAAQLLRDGLAAPGVRPLPAG